MALGCAFYSLQKPGACLFYLSPCTMQLVSSLCPAFLYPSLLPVTKPSLGGFLLLLKSPVGFPSPLSSHLPGPVLGPALPLPLVAHTRARMVYLQQPPQVTPLLKPFQRFSHHFQDEGHTSWYKSSLLFQVFHIPLQFLYLAHNIFFKYARLFETFILSTR